MEARLQELPSLERTLVLIKPDGVKNQLIGRVVRRLETSGFKLVGMKLCRVAKQHAELHLSRSADRLTEVGRRALQWCDEQSLFPMEIYGTVVPECVGQKIREWRIDFLMSGPVVALALEGEGVVAAVKKMVGHSFPDQAWRGTIRCDYGHGRDSIIKSTCERRAVQNVAHASSSQSEAEREISVWFSPGELL